MSIVNPFGTYYKVVPASTTGQILGSKGGTGETLVSMVASITNATNSQVTIADGTTTFNINPANTPVGTYSVIVNP